MVRQENILILLLGNRKNVFREKTHFSKTNKFFSTIRV